MFIVPVFCEYFKDSGDQEELIKKCRGPDHNWRERGREREREKERKREREREIYYSDHTSKYSQSFLGNVSLEL